MKLKCLALASTLSLLLGIATVYSWARSHRHIELITFARWDRYFSAASLDHHLWITVAHGWPNEPFTRWPESIGKLTLLEPVWRRTSPNRLHVPGLTTEWGDAAFYTPKYRIWSTMPPSEPVVFIKIHFIWPTVIFLILPARMFNTMFKRRNAAWICRNCSYDLTGNTSGTCPECGTAIAGTSA